MIPALPTVTDENKDEVINPGKALGLTRGVESAFVWVPGGEVGTAASMSSARSSDHMKVPEMLLALLLPAVAVGLRKGFLSKESGIAWLLELPGHIPAVIYAIGIINAS